MSFYIIIRGPAGVGKSTIANLLASKINASVTHFDHILKEMGIDDVADDRWIPLDRFLAADEVVIPRVQGELQSGRNAVMEGNFYHREQIDDITGRLDFPHAAFTLKADLGECIRRDQNKKTALGAQATEAVFGLVSAFDYGTTIQTDNKTPAEVVIDILAVLTASL